MHGPVAHLVEHLTCTEGVAGSSPVGSTDSLKILSYWKHGYFLLNDSCRRNHLLVATRKAFERVSFSLFGVVLFNESGLIMV